jgi:hypothetical protein
MIAMIDGACAVETHGVRLAVHRAAAPFRRYFAAESFSA